MKFKDVEIEEYTIDECELILCADTFLFKKESDWFIECKDQEYTFALHRWNWLTYLASDVNTTSKNLNWGIKEIEKWQKS